MNDKTKTAPQEELITKEMVAKKEAHDAAAKKEAEELDQQQKAQQTPDKPLDPASAKVAKAIMDSDVDANTVETDVDGQVIGERTEEAYGGARHEAARDKLRRIALSYQPQSPNEHIIFGAGGIKYTLGDLRDLFGFPR